MTPPPPPKGVQEWLTNRPDKQGWPQPQAAMTTMIMIMIMMNSRQKEMTPLWHAPQACQGGMNIISQQFTDDMKQCGRPHI